MNMHSNSLSTNRIAVVDLGYDKRKFSADGHLIVHDILHTKVEYPILFLISKKDRTNCWRWYSQMVESNSYHICWLIEYLGMFWRNCQCLIKPDQEQDMTWLNLHRFTHDTSSCSTTYSAMLLNMTASIRGQGQWYRQQQHPLARWDVGVAFCTDPHKIVGNWSSSMAARHGSQSTSNCPLCNLSALAADNQLSCCLSARLPRSQSTQNCQLRCTPFSPAGVFSPSATRWLGCNLSPPLQLCPALYKSSGSLSAQLYFVSSAATYLL